MWKLQPPEKCHPLFPSNPPLKDEVLPSLSFFKIWLEAQPLSTPAERRGGEAHYVIVSLVNKLSQIFKSMVTEKALVLL